MRIAIPSDDGITIAIHTGRASGFIIYEISDKQATRLEYRTNRYTGHALGQCKEGEDHSNHHHSHDSLLDALTDCQAMLAHGMGPRLVQDLALRNIEVIFCTETQAEEVAQKLSAGQLTSTGKSGCDRG